MALFYLTKLVEVPQTLFYSKLNDLFGAKKAGHTGSLDPLASGLLPICLGQATKVAQFLLDDDKRYFVRAKLGQISSTGDSEGKIVNFGSTQGY